jgi:hypothetical protein
MFAETLLQTKKAKLNLTVRVKMADLDFPRSESEMTELLLTHALGCRKCLAVVLFEDVSLAEKGCQEYRDLLGRMRTALRTHLSLETDQHVNDDVLDEYFFNRLSPEETAHLEKHVLVCDQCAQLLHTRQLFFVCVRAALRDKESEGKNSSHLSGVLGLSAPEAGLNLFARLNI